MQNELTPKIKEWLDTDPHRRDVMAGAMLLLQTTRNRILYANITRNPTKYAQTLEYQLKKVYNQRMAKVTHEQVANMMSKVEAMERSGPLRSDTQRSEWQKGKRADHDELPPEVRQLYTDNADILRRMREAHTRLRMISPETSTCPDNDRYPIAKYLIELDTRYRDNWNRYDHYVKGTDPESTKLESDKRSESRNAAKLCALLLGQYRKQPNEALAERIKQTYAKVTNPGERLREKMAEAKLII